MASPFFSSTRHGVVDIHKRRRDVLKRARRFENEREFVLKRVLSPFYYHRTQPHTHTHTHTHHWRTHSHSTHTTKAESSSSSSSFRFCRHRIETSNNVTLFCRSAFSYVVAKKTYYYENTKRQSLLPIPLTLGNDDTLNTYQ